jgi:hypothetical protein
LDKFLDSVWTQESSEVEGSEDIRALKLELHYLLDILYKVWQVAGYVTIAMLSLLVITHVITSLSTCSAEEMKDNPMELFQLDAVPQKEFCKHWGSEVSSDCGEDYLSETEETPVDQVR